MLVIGLTGSLSTGKSTVAKMFKNLGAVVLDADKEVHQLWSLKGKNILRIKKILGPSTINKGGVNKKKIAQIIFKNKSKRRQLEKILHAQVKKSFAEKIRLLKRTKRTNMIVLDVPLLFESGMDKMADVTLVVTAGRELQIQRSMKKMGISRQETLRRIQAQMPLGEKIKLADFVIDNQSSKIMTQRKVSKIWHALQRKQKR